MSTTWSGLVCTMVSMSDTGMVMPVGALGLAMTMF